MRAGTLRHYIDIQYENSSADGNGQLIPSWTNITNGTNIPAEVLAVGGGERVRGQQIEAGVTTLVTMRYRSDVTALMRIVHGSRNLNIVRAVDPDGRSRRLVCQCQEVA